MTNLQLWRVHLTGHWQTREPRSSVDTSVLRSTYGVCAGRVVGLRFGGHVFGRRAGRPRPAKLKGQPRVSSSLNQHRASLRPNGTRRDDLKINKPISCPCFVSSEPVMYAAHSFSICVWMIELIKCN